MFRQSDPFADATYADVGTTAEIYEVLEDGGNHSMRLKAIGRQRFKLLETKQDSEGYCLLLYNEVFFLQAAEHYNIIRVFALIINSSFLISGFQEQELKYSQK